MIGSNIETIITNKVKNIPNTIDVDESRENFLLFSKWSTKGSRKQAITSEKTKGVKIDLMR